MTGDDPPGVGVEPWAIERMRHFANQAMDCVPRQPGVGVKREDIADTARHLWLLRGGIQREGTQDAAVLRTAQQTVQFVQLAALALPTDPSHFAGVPDPLAVHQQEAVAT